MSAARASGGPRDRVGRPSRSHAPLRAQERGKYLGDPTMKLVKVGDHRSRFRRIDRVEDLEGLAAGRSDAHHRTEQPGAEQALQGGGDVEEPEHGVARGDPGPAPASDRGGRAGQEHGRRERTRGLGRHGSRPIANPSRPVGYLVRQFGRLGRSHRTIPRAAPARRRPVAVVGTLLTAPTSAPLLFQRRGDAADGIRRRTSDLGYRS